MIATACILALSLLLRCRCYSACSSSLITITQLVQPGSSSLHKPPSLFSMTLPMYSLTLTGISLSCKTHAGCGSISSITISHPEQQVTLKRDLLQHYVSSNWTYETSFKLYLGPASSRYLTLSIHFDSVAPVSPVTVSSTLYGCEADRDAVPTRQILQYDLIPAPSTPDPEYTGLVNNKLVSGGVGILTDQKTETTMTWHLAENKKVSLLFRLDKNYSLTSVNILSPNHSSFELTQVRAELTDCEFTLRTSLLLDSCEGSYFLLTVRSKHTSFSISEVQLLTEEGQLSGKKYPINITSSNGSYSPIVLVFIVFFVTFLLTSLLCIILAAGACTCYRRRRGYERWSFRSLNFQRRKRDYETVKMSSRSSDSAQHTAEKVKHDYCTLKIEGELEASLYVDMSSSVVPNPSDTPPSPPPPPPKADRTEPQYVSMRIRSGSSAGSGPGGFLARLKYWGTRTQATQLVEEGEVGTESAGENVGTTKSLGRRGGVKMKSSSPHTSRPAPAPARPPLPAADAPSAQVVCEKEVTEVSGEKEASELKNSK